MSEWFKFRSHKSDNTYYGKGQWGEATYLLHFTPACKSVEYATKEEIAAIDLERNGPEKLADLITEIHDVQRHNETVTLEARIIEAIKKLNKIGAHCSTPAITRCINASGFKISVTSVRRKINRMEGDEILAAHGLCVAPNWNFA